MFRRYKKLEKRVAALEEQIQEQLKARIVLTGDGTMKVYSPEIEADWIKAGTALLVDGDVIK